MGVRTGVRCCGEAMAGGRESAIFHFFFRLSGFLCVRSGTTLRTFCVVGGRCSKRVKVAFGENGNFKQSNG